MNNTRLVYSTESGQICPSCGHPTTKCTCKKKKTVKKQSIYPNDGTVRIRREVKDFRDAPKIISFYFI